MAMLISKFHKLIQSRLLWGIFLIVIVFSFVIWGTQVPDSSERSKEANSAGKLDGKYVSQDEFRHAYYNVFMSVCLMVGQQPPITERLDKEIRESAWGRLIALRTADKMGITALDQEVLAAIQNNSGFMQDGRFSRQQYDAFVQQVLYRMGFSEPQFEQHVREEIVLQKLRHLVQQTILIPPATVKNTFDTLTDKFEIEYVALTVSDVAKEISVSEDDARKFFLADPIRFEIPEQVKVDYVSFPIADFLQQAIITDADALDYYNEHIDDYMTSETNDTLEQAALDPLSTNALADQTLTIPFEEVKTNILEHLQFQAARNKAADAATDMVVALSPDRSGDAPTFDELSTKLNLEVQTTEPFGIEDEVPGVDAGMTFNKAAFALNKTPEEYFSDAVVGEDHVYIIALQEKIPARTPEFDEVKDEVMEAARENAIVDALTKKAQDMREAAEKALADGKTFASAIKPFGLKTVPVEEFSLSSGMPETNEYSSVILRGIVVRNQGEVTDLLPTEDAVLLAYIAKRTPGDQSTFDALKPQIVESFKRQRGQQMFEEWKQYLLTSQNFEERKAPESEDESEVEDEDVSGDDSEQEEQPE